LFFFIICFFQKIIVVIFYLSDLVSPSTGGKSQLF
jgi:hypothetical protein